MPESRILTDAVERLSNATDLATITQIVAEAARELVGSDGATFVLKDEDKCYYADENAISPLWKGKRFPSASCISGWCMANRQVVTIRDIYKDSRIPHDAYRPTFVKSLCMVPIRSEAPIGAIGNYWARDYEPTPEQVKLLQILSNSSATALENLQLREMLSRRDAEHHSLTNKSRELEFQLHSLAHDLKNPLATMMGVAELIVFKNPDLDDQTKEYLWSIVRTGQRMNRQVHKMLALYRLSNQTIRKAPVDLSAVFKELIDDHKSHNPRRKVETKIADGLEGSADADLIRLALENLVSNAFKYSSRKPTTRIRFDRLDTRNSSHESAFLVEDEGDGFDPLQAGLLFKPLVRLHTDAQFPGTGLGLASVARIIELHGGRVWAEGRPAQGATFYFTLPKNDTN